MHRCLTHPIRYDIDVPGLFDRAEPCTLGRAPALRLSPEDSLLHLEIYRSFHGCGFDTDGRNILDAHRLVSQREIDWNALLARARGCANTLWILLDSAQQRHAAAVPADFAGDLRPNGRLRRHLDRVRHRDQRAWIFRWPKLPTWPRRILLLPIILDRRSQQHRSIAFYARIRVRDAWESGARRMQLGGAPAS